MNLSKSEAIFAQAQAVIPGGVNSPVRAYRTVGGTPPHLVRGEGAYVWDEDGNRYLDMVLSYGPLILGHGHPAVTAALHTAVDLGITFGHPTAGELRMAQTIVERVRSVEMVRLVNSGTEATLSAARLVRAATGRDHILKFNGCYHGHGDSFLIKAGSGALTLGAPDSPGVPQGIASLSLVAEYNDLDSVRAQFEAHPGEIAGIFVEPVAGNMGLIPPDEGFLEGLRALCDQFGALLVFDEVMTGFRVAKGGYQELTEVTPDLTCLGKVIGGGLPIGAYGGRKDLMQRISPAGDVYQAGTLSGNPLAVAAGQAMLDSLAEPGVYEGLQAASREVREGLHALAKEFGIDLCVQSCGAMFCLYLGQGPIRNLDDVSATDREGWNLFFNGMLERGVLLPPSPFEAWFLSTAHGTKEIKHLLDAARGALSALATHKAS